MFPGTVTALKTREHQRDGNSEADFRRQERSHPGSKWGQLGHRCFQPPPLLSLKVFYTALGLRCRKLYVYTTAHQTAVNRMMGFFWLGNVPLIQNQNILWKLVLSWQESIKPSLWDAAVVISNAKLLLYYCFIVTFNMERFSIAQGKKKKIVLWQ